MLPPRPDDDLLSRADLVGYARVLTVKNGIATLRFRRILKGRPKGRGIFARLGLSKTAVLKIDAATGTMEDGRLVVVDSGNQYLFVPGTELRAYLRWNAESEIYESVWWNAVSRAK